MQLIHLDAEKYSWEENFAGSSGLSDSKTTVTVPGPENSKVNYSHITRSNSRSQLISAGKNRWPVS